MTTINRLTFNEPRDVLPYERDTLTVRVSSDGADLALEFLGPSDDIFGERISCQLSESWPFHQRRYLCLNQQGGPGQCIERRKDPPLPGG